MQTLHIILQPKAGPLRIGSQLHPIQEACLLFVVGTEPVIAHDAVQHSFTTAAIQSIYRELQHLLAANEHRVEINHPHAVAVNATLIDAAEHLADIDPQAMLRFVLTYCVAVDPNYGGAMLHWMINGDRDLFDFIDVHRLEPWPVARYASELGLTLRKFNQLFQEKYGVSAKSWLLEQRVTHARQLLQTTTNKVTDIAIEVGFSTHAHFCDSFKRRYGISPTDLRKLEPASCRRTHTFPSTGTRHEY